MFKTGLCLAILCISASAAAPSAPTRPLLFEPTEAAGGFLARGPDHSLRFTSTGIDFSGPAAPLVHLSFAGARTVVPLAEAKSISETHYFLGNDKSKWRTGVPNYERIRYAGIYPGIDLLVYATDGSFEYDLELAPHADPSKIRMRVQGTNEVSVNADGDLELGKGGFRLRQPRVRQEGQRIEAGFRVGTDSLVRFDVASFDHAKPLVIDPVITFSTFHGGSYADVSTDVTVDKDGNVYVAGYTVSENFPGPVLFGRFPSIHQFGFVTKYAPMVGGKSQLLYSILLGSNIESALTVANAVAVDGTGNVIVGGLTSVAQFPTSNAAQPQLAVAQCSDNGGSMTACPDAFLTKFAPDGRTLVFSTYYGGKDLNLFERVITDPAGGIYALGRVTGPTTFAGTSDAFRTSTPGGGDVQLVRFSPTGQVIYATYLGGSGEDRGHGIVLEAPGIVWIAGETQSADMPTTSTSYQPVYTAFRRAAFVARIDTTRPGSAGLTYGTFFGNSTGNSIATQILRDASGQVVFCGSHFSGLPATTDTAFQPQAFGAPLPAVVDLFVASGDAFIARLNPLLSGKAQLTYASNVGGNQYEDSVQCALDANGNFLVAGRTASGFPFFTPGSPLPYKDIGGAQGGNLFLIRIDPRVAGGRLESILFGGIATDYLGAMAVDANKKFAYMTGRTTSTQFPITSQATQKTYGGNTLTVDGRAVDESAGVGDVWVAQIDLVAPQVAPTQVGLRTGDYQFVNPGGVLPVNPSVQMQDANGNPVPLTGYTVDYTGTNVTALTTSSVTDTDGITGNAIRVVQEGPATLVATIAGLTPYTFHFKAISGTLPTSAVILSGAGQSGKAGTEMPQPLVVEIRDATNAPMRKTGIPVQFKVDNVTVSAAVVETDAEGRASTRVTLGTKPGSMKVTVVVGAFPELIATFSATGPVISAAGIVNAATFVGGSVSPGLIVTIFGDKIGPATLALGSAANGKFLVALGETRVLFDGVAAPLVYVSAGQTSAIVPYSVAGKASTQVVVEYQGNTSNAATVPVVAARPGLFSANSSGSGQGALLNEDNSVNSATNPIARRKIVVLFGTGEGETTPAGVDGQLANTVFPKPKLPVHVRIGGVDAEVLYAGAAPTLVAGVLQVNVRIPASTPDGNAIAELFVGDAQSPATITIAVKGD